ncbi:MAG: GNAT family protein [Micropruina sp.]|uniref:GNAT family N-acetyltransferase n=1 Tax=Micropruina sp. TaxID=2737536 RepID=UPI0039E2E02E
MTDPELRPLRAADAPDVLAAFLAASDMARQGDVTDARSALAYVERLTEVRGPHLAFGVVHAARVVGVVGLTVDTGNRNGWFWYWMHADFRGRGWTSRAAASVADWALREGGIQRLELGHRVNNPASGAVARAAGFVREGLERSKLLIDGERLDVVAYSRLPGDPWPVVPRLPILAPPRTR